MKNKKMSLWLLLVSLIIINLTEGANIAYVPKTGPGDTMAAGRGKQWPDNRFILDASGNCIIDNLTGLVWTRDANFLGAANWTNSYNRIVQMNNSVGTTGYYLCGYGDWRMPNVNELMSLINYTLNPSPSEWLNTQGFINFQSASPYWSSNIGSLSQNYYVIDYNEGSLSQRHRNTVFNIIAVRGGK